MRRVTQALMPHWRDERGAALPLALMALVVLGVLSVALLTIGGSEVRIAGNHLRGTQAVFVAEGGVERAIAQFVANPDLVTNATTNTVTLFSNQTLGTIGTYTVTYRSVGFATVQIVSTGQTALDSAVRTVESVATTHFIADHALLGDEGVKMKKNSSVKGEAGSVHDNKKMEVKCDSGLCVEKTATSSTDKCQNCTDPARVGIPGSSGGNKPSVKLPKVKPTDFAADYILGDDGTIRDKAGTILYNEKDDKTKEGWGGWTMGGRGEWVNDGDSPPNGTYYASKRIRITGNPGAPGAPWKATLLAGSAKNKGKVDILGDAVMEPSTPGVLIVAGKVKIKWEKPDDDEEEDADDKEQDAKAKEDDDSDDKKNDDDEAKDDADHEDKEKKSPHARPRGYVDLKGSIIATSHKDNDKNKGKGRVKMSGDVRLNGNVIAQGRIEIKGATVTYNPSNPPRLTGSLQVIAWSTRAQ